MTRRLNDYYKLNEYYGELAEKDGADIVKISDELTRGHNRLLAQMTEDELLYLQGEAQGMSKMRFEPYLKKLRGQKTAKRKPSATRPSDEFAAAANFK